MAKAKTHLEDGKVVFADHTSRSVGANSNLLTSFNRSMAVALDRVENGSQAENIYFLEKLEKSARLLGYELKELKYNKDDLPVLKMENTESRQIRALSESVSADFSVSLPTLPVVNWLDGTVEETKEDVVFVDVNLADLLGFVADMVE